MIQLRSRITVMMRPIARGFDRIEIKPIVLVLEPYSPMSIPRNE